MCIGKIRAADRFQGVYLIRDQILPPSVPCIRPQAEPGRLLEVVLEHLLMVAAQKHLPEFGIAAECGFGRELPENVLGILELHKQIADELLS